MSDACKLMLSAVRILDRAALRARRVRLAAGVLKQSAIRIDASYGGMGNLVALAPAGDGESSDRSAQAN